MINSKLKAFLIALTVVGLGIGSSILSNEYSTENINNSNYAKLKFELEKIQQALDVCKDLLRKGEDSFTSIQTVNVGTDLKDIYLAEAQKERLYNDNKEDREAQQEINKGP